MKKYEKYAVEIQKNFPDFTISSIRKTGEGDNSKAFILNENYIFRFPKRNEVKQQISREIVVLPKIKPLLNLNIPEFKFISPDLNFVGYKIIQGKPLTFKIYQSLNKKQKGNVCQSLGIFLSQLHQLNIQILKDCNLETMNPKEEYSDNFNKAQKYIYPNISKEIQKIITQLFSKYLSNPANFNYVPVLIHNDFSADHILFDSAKGQITGIIDFGDIAFGDPDYELMYLLDEFGEGFLNEIFKTYKPKNKKRFVNKLYFFSLANKIQIIIGNRNNKDPEQLKNEYQELNLWFKKFYFVK